MRTHAPPAAVQDRVRAGEGGGAHVVGPGLLVVEDVLLGPAATLRVENATLALTGRLELGAGARLELVDSILAAADTPQGRLPPGRTSLAANATIEPVRSEWWGPDLG